ncbi:MAG: beta strand repeat-containing protein, partial [Chryseotalea sp.]
RTDVTPQCERIGTFTVRVNPKPITVNLDGTPIPDKGVIQFCEDNILTPGQATSVNLTVFNGEITTGGGFTFTWHTTQADADNDVNAIVANSTTVNNATPNYFVRVENNTTGCFNTAAVVANVRALPAANPIVGSASRCAGLTPPDQGFYFISPAADRDYQWTVPAVFTNVGGVTTNFNVFLEFPTVVNPSQNISVVERIRYSTGYTTIPLYDASGILRCTGAPNTFAITANASPAPIVIVGDFDLCENEVFTYEATPSNAPISSYDWEIDPPTAASIIVVPNTNRAQVSASTTNFQIKVKEVSASCTGPQATQVITVNPRPALAPASSTICSDDPTSGLTLAVTNPATFPGATFNITNVNVQPGLVPPTRATVSGGAPGVLFNDTFNNLTGGNLVVSYTVEPVSTSGCAGASAIVQLTVRPEPVLQSGLFDEICSTTEAVEIILGLSSGSSPADEYVVETINTNGLIALAGSPATGTFTSTSFLLDDRWENKTAASVDVIYNIKPRNSGTTCVGDPAVPVTVRVKPEPIVTPLPTDIICSGDSPTITLAATPAVGSNFAWSIGSITGLISGASSGNGTVNIPDILINNTGATGSVVYSVRATLNGCVSASQNVRVDINPAPTANDVTQTICSDAAGGNNAVISLTALQNSVNSGGGITFNWFEDLALSSPIATPGSYTIVNGDPVFVNVDNGQCTKVAQVSYTINPTPQVLTAKTLSYNTFDVSCTGAANGQLTATPSLGTGPYLFSIDAGASFFTSNVFNGLSAAGGPYVVRVRDFNGCIANSTPLTIVDPPALTVTAARSFDHNGADVSCQAASDGEITATAVGGTGTVVPLSYTYQILELASNTSGNGDGVYDGLRAGTYTILARDLNGCQATANVVTLIDPPAILPTAVLTSPVSCNGSNDGVITVTATGGTELGTYTFTLVQPPATTNNTGIIGGLGAGTYTIRVQDDNNCFVISNPVNVTQPSALTAFASVTSNYNGAKISCFGADDAQVTVTPNGGNGGYTFLLVQGTNGTGDVDGSYENLPPGNYSIQVSDVEGCTVTTALVNVAEPTQVIATAIISDNISCFGVSDGEITVFANGGTGAYTFERVALPTNISNTSGVFGGLADGTYNFNVRDLNLCLGTTSQVIVQPTQVVASATVDTPYNGTQISCNGASDGIIRVSGTGGTGSYSFKVKEPGPTGITFNSSSGVFNNLRAGIGYEYTVTDIEGCFDSDFIDIEEPDVVTGTASIVFPPAFNGQAIRCFGESNASVNIVGSGGVGSITGVFNFTYTITELPLNNSGFNSGTFTGLPAGTFNATVRDANGCPFAVAPFVITPPTQLQISGSVTSNYFGQQITCFGEDDGIITATASGGVTAYTYELLLAPGGTTVGAPQASTVFNGSIPANTYQIKLTDANGCERTSANIVVSQPTQITATASLVKGIDCFGDNNAIIRVTRSGGTSGNAVYTFTNPPTPAPTPPSASTGTTATFFDFTNVSFGTGFGFTVTDINGCPSPISNLIDVVEPPQLVVTAVKRSPYNGGRDISCFGAKDGIVDVTSVGGTGTVEFKFDQDFGNTSGQTSGVFINLDVYPAPGLTFTGKDDNECEATSNPVLLIQPDPISTTAAGSAINNANRGGFDISCFNGNDGTLEVAIPLSGEFGGTPAYTYTLLENPLNNSGQSNGVFTNLRAGNYRVRIIDVNNCSFITPTATIIQPTRLTVTAVKQSPYNGFDVSCDVATDGRLTVTATNGGVPAYSYQLFKEGISTTEPIAGNVFNNLEANVLYTVVVTDLNDCTAESLPIILIPPNQLFPGVVGIDVSRCESGNNSDVAPFQVTPPIGGIGNYTFEWIRVSDNAVVGTTATIDPDAFLNITPGATTPQVVSFIRRVTSSVGPGAPAPCQIADSPIPVTVTVNPLPVADFKLSDPLNDVICPGSTVLLDANFTVGTEPYRFEFTEVRS